MQPAVPAFSKWVGKKSTCSHVRSNFFSKRGIKVWNDMPSDTVDFTSLTTCKKSIMRADITAHLKCFP